MLPVFVDTGGWIAMAVVRDRFHKQAGSYYRKLSGEKSPLVTSNYVLVETYTRIRYDDGHAKALQFNSLVTFKSVYIWFLQAKSNEESDLEIPATSYRHS